MKVLIGALVYYPEILGGGEISTQLLCEGLAKRGHDVHVLCLGMKNCTEIINNVKIKRIYIPKASEIYCLNLQPNLFSKVKLKLGDYIYNYKLYKLYFNYFNDLKPDIVHSTAHMSNMGRYNFWRAASDLKIPVSHVFRCPSFVEKSSSLKAINKLKILLNKRSIKFVNFFAAPSRYMLDLHKILDSRIILGSVIYNSVDLKNKTTFLPKKRIVLYAGVLKKDKGVITLVKAYKCIKDNTCRLIMVGQGELKTYLQSQGVIVYDWMQKERLYELMNESTVVVLPSEWPEAFGRIIIEAVANGTLAIGSEIGGIPEVFGDEIEFLFESGNVDSLQKKLCWILNMDENEYNRYVLRLQNKFQKYSIDLYIKNWESFFYSQVNNKNKNS